MEDLQFIMQKLVPTEEAELYSKSRLRKMRRMSAEEFLERARSYPNWRKRLTEITEYIVVIGPFKLRP